MMRWIIISSLLVVLLVVDVGGLLVVEVGLLVVDAMDRYDMILYYLLVINLCKFVFNNQVTVLYVRNLSMTTTEQELRNIFNAYTNGQVTKLKMMRDFAFVHFK